MLSRRLLAASAIIALFTPLPALAQNESVVVYGTAGSDIGIARGRIPGTVQALSAEDLNRNISGSLLNSLGNRLAGVTLNDVQGNELFQDLRYRGFAASPLQGTAQGVAVYQNGVRLNEAFGDTVNWDMIPENAIAGLDMWSNNPAFGLNALGGAINLTMKNGFTFQGGTFSVQGGSFRNTMGSVEYGMRDGDASLYVALDGLKDGGWRPRSASGLVRLYADGGYRFGDSEIHVVASGAVTGLGVIGPTPADLIARRGDSAIYTSPQTTQNRMGSLALNGKTKLADNWQLSGNFYARTLRQRHLDGNDAEFERCSASSSFRPFLCLEDDGFPRPVPFTGAAALNFRNQFVLVGPDNQPAVPFTAGVVYGTLDRTATDATSFGGTLQLSSNAQIGGMDNYFIAGARIDHSNIGFQSRSTLARINSELLVALDPSLPGSGTVIHTAGQTGFGPATLRATNSYYNVYAIDSLSLLPSVTLTAGVSLSIADVDTNDRSGTAPELTGSHGFTRANPLTGLTWDTGLGVSVYGGYSESSRAPTPLELSCADPNRPCLLEGSLTADPPLNQVSAHTYEAGLRLPGIDVAGGTLSADFGFFHTDVNDDIVPLASNILGRGYFTNVPATARQGIDTALRFEGEGWSAYVNYSFLQATYEFTGTIASPNNPAADANGNVFVTPGRFIPLNPAHTLRIGGDAKLTPEWSLGFDASFTGPQYFDGDQSNQNPKLPSYWTVTLRSSYQLLDNFQIYGEVNNLFDSRNATYGTFFETGGVGNLITPAMTDERSLTLLRPRSFMLGVKATF
jgi:iron complex outermembrane receptor protein